MLVDCSDQLRVVGLSGAAAVLPVRGTGFSDCQSRARYAENIADRFHWSLYERLPFCEGYHVF
jgi:hypothetical protein